MHTSLLAAGTPLDQLDGVPHNPPPAFVHDVVHACALAADTARDASDRVRMRAKRTRVMVNPFGG